MFNMIIVNGRVANEPRIKTVKNGTKIMEFCFANNLTITDANFFIVSLWQENLFQYIEKGKVMTVAGEFKIQKYIKKDGTQGATYHIKAVRVDFIKDSDKPKKEIEKKNLTPNDFSEDDIPF